MNLKMTYLIFVLLLRFCLGFPPVCKCSSYRFLFFVVQISRHPEADTLYVEKIDVGAGEGEGPRTIVSGLVNFCSEDDMRGRDVVVLCNLKPVSMKVISCVLRPEEATLLICTIVMLEFAFICFFLFAVGLA